MYLYPLTFILAFAVAWYGVPIARQAALKYGIVDAPDGRETTREQAVLPEGDPKARAAELAARGVSVLICGAISMEHTAALTARGIAVIPDVCGPVEEVLQAFLAGSLTDGRFAMPGCCGRRRRFRGGGGVGRGRPWALETGD